mmetsp:Transcript_30098/g.70176  ORF Transcript_30098/g.70176 Transcript_30098/m.70176 type:complete len:208 (-) Transcript_30098:2285-2908(-)
MCGGVTSPQQMQLASVESNLGNTAATQPPESRGGTSRRIMESWKRLLGQGEGSESNGGRVVVPSWCHGWTVVCWAVSSGAIRSWAIGGTEGGRVPGSCRSSVWSIAAAIAAAAVASAAAVLALAALTATRPLNAMMLVQLSHCVGRSSGILVTNSLVQPDQDTVSDGGWPHAGLHHLLKEVHTHHEVAGLDATMHQSVVHKLVALKA